MFSLYYETFKIKKIVLPTLSHFRMNALIEYRIAAMLRLFAVQFNSIRHL